MLTWLSPDNLDFPPLEKALADPNGLLAAGGDLSPERLIAAYRHGCFPWYQAGQPLLWWSLDPRGVLYLDELHIPRSLHKWMRRGLYHVTFDQAFNAVVQGCAAPRQGSGGTWITDNMQHAYSLLHAHGIAHSVEVWQDDQLVGGLYGVALGRIFFGESMFNRANNASKVALVKLVEHLRACDFVLIDCQQKLPNTEALGARHISRAAFSQALKQNLGIAAQSNWKNLA